MPTQRYNVLSGKVRRICFGIIFVEIDGVRARKWNAERLIMFQSVILQRYQGVNYFKYIRVRILF